MTILQKLKTQFLEHLEIEKNRSRLTIENYDHYLQRFLEFASGHGVTAPEKIDLDLARSYRLLLNRQKDKLGKNLKLVTQNYHVIALRSFLKYLVKRDFKTLAAEKLELPKTQSRQVQFLENEEVKKLIDATGAEKNELAFFY